MQSLKLTSQLMNQLCPKNPISAVIQTISVHNAKNVCNQSGHLKLLWETIKSAMTNLMTRSNLTGLDYPVLTKAMTSFQTSNLAI